MSRGLSSAPVVPDFSEKLSQEEEEVIGFIIREAERLTGNQLSGESKKHMVIARLKKRAQELKLQSLKEYEKYYLVHKDIEAESLVSLLTTHHTYFFREFSHFEHLLSQLPSIVDGCRRRGETEIRVWSAACSRGQEVYSLAMLLSAHLPKIAPGFSFRIFGTDIDAKSVEFASNGVYPYDEIKTAPLNYVGNHWARGTGDISNFVKAKKSLTEFVSFEKFNLLEPRPLSVKPFHAIFCRNVFIYFNGTQVASAVRELIKYLHQDGYFYIGISENLYNLSLPLVNVGASSFVRTDHPSQSKKESKATMVASTSNVTSPKATPIAVDSLPRPLKVLCVDDSPSILTLLRKVLSQEEGFEVVGTAKNGVEAEALVKSLKPHVVTLDIHMPEMDGVMYLEKYFKAGHPPVVMVSSVSRESEDLALRSLKLGAVDYVEKPSLSDLADRAYEIRSKLRTAFRAVQSHGSVSLQLDREFSHHTKVTQPEAKAVVILAAPGDFNRVGALVKQLSHRALPGIYVILDGPEPAMKHGLGLVTKASGITIFHDSNWQKVGPGQVKAVNIDDFDKIVHSFGVGQVAVLALGDFSNTVVRHLASHAGLHLLAEDQGKLRVSGGVADLTKYVMPFTSFAYTAVQWMERPEKV